MHRCRPPSERAHRMLGSRTSCLTTWSAVRGNERGMMRAKNAGVAVDCRREHEDGGGLETSLSDRRERGRLSRNRASQAASIISGAHSHLRRSHSVTCPTHPNRRRLSSMSCRYFPCQLAFGGERVSASPPFFLLRPPTAFNHVRSPSSDSHRACGSQVYYLTSPAVSLRRLTHPSLTAPVLDLYSLFGQPPDSPLINAALDQLRVLERLETVPECQIQAYCACAGQGRGACCSR